MSLSYEQPRWVATDRPRWIKEWTPSTTVFVTDWGDCVHLDPNCPGTRAYGSDGRVRKAQLQNRICAARSGCGKCFGEFFGESSRRELVRLIDRLHGTVDDDQPARRVIAAKARLRFGKGQSGSSPSEAQVRGPGSPQPGAVRSSGYGKPPRKSGGAVAPTVSGSPSAVNEAEAKRERDRLAAAELGITVEELKERRRAIHEANVAKKQARRNSG